MCVYIYTVVYKIKWKIYLNIKITRAFVIKENGNTTEGE